MSRRFSCILLIFLLSFAISLHGEAKDFTVTPKTKGEYVVVNGMGIYVEQAGEGRPLVLLHGGLSTIKTSFEKQILGIPVKKASRTDAKAATVPAGKRPAFRSNPASDERMSGGGYNYSDTVSVFRSSFDCFRLIDSPFSSSL